MDNDLQIRGFLRNGSKRSRRLFALVLIFTLAAVERTPVVKAQNEAGASVARDDWQPTSTAAAGKYVGSKVCATCHEAEASTQFSTRMAHSLSPVADCQVLKLHPRLKIQLGRYSYLIVSKQTQATYTVSDGNRSITEILLGAFGAGTGGQSYIWKRDGNFYESRVSYYGRIGNLDLTLGHPPAEPPSLELAEGRSLSEADALRCFSCHATPAAGESRLQLNHLVPGISVPIGDGGNPSPSGEASFGVTWSRATLPAGSAHEDRS